MDEIIVEFAESAFKHGHNREDIMYAFRYYRYDGLLKGEANRDKYLRLGVDSAGNLLEIVYHEIDEHTYVIFHCMKCQSKYYSLLN